jgi:hypothetical protein
MGKKALVYSAALIALYLVVDNAANSSKTVSQLGTSANNLVKTFQGR